MCGVAGTVAIGPARGPVDADAAVSGALYKLRHRGPDGAGVARVDLAPWGHATLGTARLAVVDRAPHALPLRDAASGCALAFNGEAYNWRSIRAELDDGTAPWATHGDGEAVLRALARWGVAALDRINGMFALAFADPRSGTVLLARDRAGEKPLYWTVDGDRLHFASEVKALPVPLVECPCPDLETLEFDCLAATPFRGVFALLPGHALALRGPADVRDPQPRAWWTVPTDVGEALGWTRAVDECEALLVDAIRLRATAEVPVAVQLSGGLDSAIVQAVAKSDRLYTVTFESDGIDNLAAARQATAGVTEPVAVTFGMDDLTRVLPAVAWAADSPTTWSMVAAWYLNERIAADGAVVVLTGEGSDEIGLGYSRYAALAHLDAMAADPALVGYGPMIARALAGDGREILARLLDRSPNGAMREHARALVDRYAGLARGDGLAAAMARLDWHVTMCVLLRMSDRATSAFSMEGRAPFLDHRLVEFMARVPVRHKLRGGETKAVFRAVARRLGVPAEITDARTKRGLAIPWSRWVPGPAWERSGFARMIRRAWADVFFSKNANSASSERP